MAMGTGGDCCRLLALVVGPVGGLFVLFMTEAVLEIDEHVLDVDGERRVWFVFAAGGDLDLERRRRRGMVNRYGGGEPGLLFVCVFWLARVVR